MSPPSAEAILAAINTVTRRGGDVYIEPVDPKNPLCGWQARVRLAIPLKSGPPTYNGSSVRNATHALVLALIAAGLLPR